MSLKGTANDLATTMTFAALQSNVTIVAFDHFEQIRTAVNTILAAQNAPPLTWRQMLNNAGFDSTMPVADHYVRIYATHILALRNAMDTALAMV